MSADTFNLIEAADYLKLGYEATKELFDTGVLPGVSLNQRHTVILRTDLDRWLHETARRQAADRRAGVVPIDRAAAPVRRKRGNIPPDLSRYEKKDAAA